MSLGSAKLILKILQEHYRGLAGVGLIDAIFLVIMGWTYVEKGDIPYLQFFYIFEFKAFISAALVVIVSLLIIWLCYPVAKKRASYEW